MCQARNAGNLAIRGYFAEGEFVPGAPAQPYYYGPDQIGSVRRVFASASNAPAYSYDPYGNALQATAALADFGYDRPLLASAVATPAAVVRNDLRSMMIVL